jgi:hypothetical protein
MPGKQAKILSENQCSLLISFLSTSRHPLRNRVIALLSIKAGLRAAEISKLDCQIASNPGSDSLPMIFAGDLGFSNGESTPCELAFGFRRLCPAGWRLTA